MRRPAVLAAIAAALLAAPAGAASPAAITDAKGDWPVASQDVVGVTVSTVPGNALRAVLTLATAPDATTQYGVGVIAGCDSWTLEARGTEAALKHYVCGSGVGAATAQPDVSAATVTTKGNTVVITAPYANGLRRGLRIDGVNAAASVYFTGVFGGSSLTPSVAVTSGDFAYGQVAYVLR